MLGFEFIQMRALNLYTRILLWLLVNVVVLGVVFLLVLKWQFAEGLQGALGGIAGDRLQVIGQAVYEDLSTHQRDGWDELLKARGRPYEAKVTLVSIPERVMMGDQITVPLKLKEIIREMNPPEGRGAPGRPPPPPGPDRPPPLLDELDAFLSGEPLPGEGRRPPQPDRLDRPEGRGRDEQRRDDKIPARFGTFLVQAGDPALYYAGVRLPPPPGWKREEGHLLLLIATDSMTGGGLFFDTRPWLLSIFGAMAISALLWLPFVKNITGSIRANMHATEQIAKGRFDVRVPEDRGDEIGRLAHGVNQMAMQLDGLLRGQKRFLGDVAHELCGPIARMEMSLGILEPRLDGGEAYRLADVRDELRQISALVDELLSFSKASLGQKAKTPEAVPLLPLVEGVLQLEGVPANQYRVQIAAELEVMAVPEMLRRAVSNVVRNGLLHAPGSLLEISATVAKKVVTLQVADSGPGVPEESLPRLFEPFYRVDVARARETGGTGLGLSIVKTCVESCGGNVSARNRETGGLIVSIELACA